MMREQLLTLPQTPGTVIAIGDWWLIRLRPYEGAPSAWELLPFPSKDVHDRAERIGVSGQCVYGDDWVLGEVDSEGFYTVISEPVTPVRLRLPAGDVMNSTSRGPQPRVSGRVETRTPRPDTVTRLLTDTVKVWIFLGALMFGSAWVAGLI